MVLVLYVGFVPVWGWWSGGRGGGDGGRDIVRDSTEIPCHGLDHIIPCSLLATFMRTITPEFYNCETGESGRPGFGQIGPVSAL